MRRKTLIPWVLVSLIVHLALLSKPSSSPAPSGSGPRVLDVGLVPLPPAVPSGAKPALANPKEVMAPASRSPKAEPVATSAPLSREKSAPPPAKPVNPETAEEKPPLVSEPAPRRPKPAEPGSVPEADSNSSRQPAKTASLPATLPPLNVDSPGFSGPGSDSPSMANPGPEARPAQATAATPPAYLRTPQPPYPRLARTRRWEGEVLVRVEVGSSGRVQRVLLERSSGYEVLDRSALEGIRAWTFRPARRNGVAIEGEVVVPIRFELQRF